MKYNSNIRVLSVRQPWAELIVLGLKDVENRSAPVTYRGTILIHASRTPATMTDVQILKRYGASLDRRMLPTGGIIGLVDLVDCVSEHASRWFDGPYGWLLRNPRCLPFTPHRGNLSLARAPEELLNRISG